MIDALIEACGAEHVWLAGPTDAVDGVPAGWVAAPADADQVSALLRVAAAEGLSVVGCGAGTKLDWGPPPSNVDLLVDLGRLGGVYDHAVDERVATVGAGTRMRALRATLGRAGQRLPLDVGSPAATVGGVLATNEAGPLRHAFGTPRDLVVGVQVVLDDGTQERSLPGQDLARLVCGSFGTLGLITEATLRLEPTPEARAWVVRPVGNPRDVRELAGALVDSSLGVAAVEADLPGGVSARGPRGVRPGEVAALFEGSRPGVLARADAAARMLGGGAAVEDMPPDWWGRYPFDIGDIALRVWGRPSELFAVFYALRDAAGAGVPVRGSAGVGVAHVALPGTMSPERVATVVTAARTVLLARGGGGCVVLRGPAPVRAAVDALGTAPLPLELARLKRELDPEERMAPGRRPDPIG